jgi:hypothetical protein
MPRAVKRAIAVVEGAKMVDQRAETGRDAMLPFNTIVHYREVVVKS